MYTSAAYFPSPFDGNYYPTYIHLDNGELTPVHFLNTQKGLQLVWYPRAAIGQLATPQLVQISLNYGQSNLVYFQPQAFGHTQQLYCASNSLRCLTLIMNTRFQEFVPIEVHPNTLESITPQEVIPHAAFMEENPNRLPVNDNLGLPKEVLAALQAVQTGALANVTTNTNRHGFHLTAEDHDGNRYILEKYSQNGITQTNEVKVNTTGIREKRLEQVKQLKAQKLSQTQIANHLGVSQKTVSNDLKELGLN